MSEDRTKRFEPCGAADKRVDEILRVVRSVDRKVSELRVDFEVLRRQFDEYRAERARDAQ